MGAYRARKTNPPGNGMRPEDQDRHSETFKGSHILITGGCGFIGASLADSLCARGARVTLLDLSGCRGSPAAGFVDSHKRHNEYTEAMSGTQLPSTH